MQQVETQSEEIIQDIYHREGGDLELMRDRNTVDREML